MITQDTIQKLAIQYHTNELNIIREYFQHLFLLQFYKMEGAEKVLFKGGTALRLVYGSPRFSEDLDFSIFNVEIGQQKKFIEDLFMKVLVEIGRIGIKVELGPKPDRTAEGYRGEAIFNISPLQPVAVVISVSSRNGRPVTGEVDSIANDFVPTYNVFHLPQKELVEEKIFDALLNRKKARDFYDLYFIMRKGLLTPEQKKRLNDLKDEIIKWAEGVDFSTELAALLPQDQHAIIQDFKKALGQELSHQLSGL